MASILWRGQVFRLKSDHFLSLTMSSRGGVPSENNLEVPAGTKIVIATNCGKNEFKVPFHFVEEPYKKYNGQPFETIRSCIMPEDCS